MAIVSRKNNHNSNLRHKAEDTSEFEGIWINVGITNADGVFMRLPLGIPISSLKMQTFYGEADTEERKAAKRKVGITNSLITKLQEASANLEAGDSITLNLDVQLYKAASKSEGNLGADDDGGYEELNNLFG